jgi:hypothetical protein
MTKQEWLKDPRCTKDDKEFLEHYDDNDELGSCWELRDSVDYDDIPQETCNDCKLAGFCRNSNADKEHFKASRLI